VHTYIYVGIYPDTHVDFSAAAAAAGLSPCSRAAGRAGSGETALPGEQPRRRTAWNDCGGRDTDGETRTHTES